MAQTATLTKTGQITIPKWVREILGVSSGDTIVFRRERNSVTIQREKTAEETAAAIDKLIPKEAREHHMKHYAGLTATEMREKWMKSEEGRAYFREEMERCL